MRVILLLATAAAFAVNVARAYPDGAPWGAANPAAEQHCAICHFGADAVHDSAALRIDGLPSKPVPGSCYELKISFDDPAIVIAGFQLLARAREQDAGTFSSDASETEFVGSAIRSTAAVINNNGVYWEIKWRAPERIMLPIVFHVAASAANDDGSPFGDTIHYKSYEITAKE